MAVRAPAIRCAFDPSADVATSRVFPISAKTWRCGAIVKPTSAPKFWLVTFPNDDCPTASTYPFSAAAGAPVCGRATPPNAIVLTIRANTSLIQSSPRASEPRLRADLQHDVPASGNQRHVLEPEADHLNGRIVRGLGRIPMAVHPVDGGLRIE